MEYDSKIFLKILQAISDKEIYQYEIGSITFDHVKYLLDGKVYFIAETIKDETEEKIVWIIPKLLLPVGRKYLKELKEKYQS